jgi:hypothetical protein
MEYTGLDHPLSCQLALEHDPDEKLTRKEKTFET